MKTELLRGRYEPLDVVGRGGEAEVMRALDHLHGRQVALKVRPVGDDGARTQLLSEARLLLSLAPHPGLPLVREDFFADGSYVIAMDWIEGTNLEALLETGGRKGLDPGLVIRYLEQAAAALEHLRTHVPAVVHGDVKPANLILTSSGRVVLVDFGLSSIPTDDLRRAGTERFVAPEVAAGARPTAAADVYSFAATAFALLTGEAPSAGALRWGAIEPERVPALERIVRPNLATDPERRDASAAAVAARLRRWWGADLPSGTVTLVLADVQLPHGDAERLVDEVARARRGHCLAPREDGPLLAAFASAQEGVEAARELATRLDARVGVASGEAEPRAGSYVGEVPAAAARLLDIAGSRQVVADGAIADVIGDRLPAELALAELPETTAATGAWALVAPGLAAPPRAAACPYLGLMAFQPEDGDLFFGREEVVATVVAELLAGGFMAVVGASGSGKSSVVRAGVLPAFRHARAADVAVMTPSFDPERQLRVAVGDRPPSLLVVDQFEEAFTLCPDEAARARFFDALIDFHENGASAVVVALRADFYGRCAEHPRLAAALAAHQCLLGPMRADDLRRAIERPARRAGLRLEAGLIDTMLADVGSEPGALPLLSHVLYESWARRDGRLLTRTGYLAAGGVRGAIAHTAEEAFLRCDGREQAHMRRMFLELTELGESTEDTRRRVPPAELLPEREGREEATAVLERLAGSRLLVVGDDSVEVAHEALIREWPRLRGWLAESREQLRALRQLTTAARSWDEAGRDDADLYRGARLAAAVDLAPDDQLSRVEREFLEASRDAQERALRSARRRASRLRALLAVVAAALVVAVIAAAVALVERGSARRSTVVAQAGRLAAQSREAAARHPDLALLLALEGGRLDDSVETRSALLGALQHGSRVRAWLRGFDSPVNGTAFSPDGRLLATATLGGTTLWDTRTWRRIGQPLPSAEGSESAAFSRDGKTLAIAGGDGKVVLWDVAGRHRLRALRSRGNGPLATVRFSPDGSVIAAGGLEDNHVTVWEATSGRVVAVIEPSPPDLGGAHSVEFSPDSRRLVAPGAAGTVGIWDVATGRRVGRPLVTGDAPVVAAIFAAGGRRVIASDESGAVSIIDAATGRALARPLSVGDKPAAALDLSPDERLLAAATFEGSVYVWDTMTGEAYGAPLTADTGFVNDVSFSPDGLMLVSSHLRSAVVWSVSGEQAIGQPLGGATDVTTDVSFRSDGTRLLVGRLDGSVLVYDVKTKRPALELDAGAVVSAVAFHPGGRLVAVGTVDGRIQFFDPRSGASVGRAIAVRNAAVWQVAFSPDGRLLAAAVDPNGVGGFYGQQRHGEVQFWDVGSRRRAGRAVAPGGGSVLSLAFSRDGALLATGSYLGRLDLWDVATRNHHGKPMRVADDGIASVAFDASGRLVAGGGGGSGLVRVWRVADQRPAFPPLAGHTGSVNGAAFDNDGEVLATTSHLGGTRLWDAATGLPYGDELVGSPRPASLVPTIDLPFLGLRNAFSPGGELLAVSGAESRGMLWEVDPAVWRRRACAIAGRNLSPEEWKLYLPTGTPYRATCPEWPTG